MSSVSYGLSHQYCSNQELSGIIENTRNMDVTKFMIVDLERRDNKKMFITEQVSSISPYGNYWKVQFKKSSEVLNYNKARLVYLSSPERICIDVKGLYINNKRKHNISELLKFSDDSHVYYRIVYKNGFSECVDGRKVYISRTAIDKNDGGKWEYLKKLAEERGLVKNGKNSLFQQYQQVDLNRDNVPLAQYLGNKSSLNSYRLPSIVLYPFGCNASQKCAVECALTNQVSVIQGPPGTGKTQTILNIIANLLMQDKTVLVVSNNNSAVDNVFEKLNDNGLGFIVAKLGNKQNKEYFISNQPQLPDLSEWRLDCEKSECDIVSAALRSVTQGFKDQLQLAHLNKEYNALLTEFRHNELLSDGPSEIPEWLGTLAPAKIMKLLHLVQRAIYFNQKLSLLQRIRWCVTHGSRMFGFLKKSNLSNAAIHLEKAYYLSRKHEIEEERECIYSRLQILELKECMNRLTTSSLLLLKNRMVQKYQNAGRCIFNESDIRSKSEMFLKQYPIVLSTTYSSRGCINPDMVFDYVIMDEASQVDIKTGALALSCATNAVIVGDDKQLPHVITSQDAAVLNDIQSAFKIDDRYNAVKHSFLTSCLEVFKNIPVTLLREHYRCHPKIIEFCNQRFYNGELVAMTADNNEENVMQVIRTVKGNHARGFVNQREIDVIVKEIMPQFSDDQNIGIITPHREQADKINQALGKDIASTVHKYQGRECDIIVLSTVLNEPTSFSDNANLLNVAVSRAKSKLCIVTSGNNLPQHSNLAQLIEYIKYNNFEVKDSGLYSVMDILYKPYTAERLAYETLNPNKSMHLSENLVYDVIVKAFKELNLSNIDIVGHYPLCRLVANWELLTDEERQFAKMQWSHVDFLIYNSLTKDPLIAIEVDGWAYHNDSTVQRSRDDMKDDILAKFDLTLFRIRTTDILTVETMKSDLLKSGKF